MNKYIAISYQTTQKMVHSSLFWNTNRKVANAIKKEISKNKHSFFEFGKVSKTELNKYLAQYPFSFPKELINIWLEYGGGELWETENILYPLASNNNLIETVEMHHEYALIRKFNDNYFIFATDTVNYTAFEKQTHKVKIFSYDNGQWTIEKSFENIIDWFSYLLWSQYNALLLTKENF